MDQEQTKALCPRCQAALPAYAPEGLCPRCLGSLNLESETGFDASGPSSSQPAPTPAELAAQFPQLEILELCGRGGMGVVYRARQKLLNRVVALKLIAPERVGDPAFADRFTREARALAALSHPNIVTIFDFGQADQYFYLLMEFVDGVNLRQAMKGGRFSPEQALAVVPPVCDALQYAHEHGIVHRDIKPENLLLDKGGRIKIADFGIARMLHVSDPDPAATSPPGGSRPDGTPQYMAPEQLTASANADHRADIYSLGVVLYELLTGQLPAQRLVPPSRKVQIDVRLDEIVMRALEQNPELRYQTAGELRTQVELATQPRVPALNHAPPKSASISALRMLARRPSTWGSIGILLVLLMGVCLLMMRLLQPPRGGKPLADGARPIDAQILAPPAAPSEINASRTTNTIHAAVGSFDEAATWTAGPVRELELKPTKGVNCFVNLERGEVLTPTAEVAAMTERPYWWEQLQAPVDRWLRANEVDLFFSEGTASGLELIHGSYGFAAGLTLPGNICPSLEELEAPRIRRALEEFIDDALIYQLSVRPRSRSQFSIAMPHRSGGQGARPGYYCFFRTGSGRYGILQTREFNAKPGSMQVRYRLLRAQGEARTPGTDSDPYSVRPELRFLAWQDQWIQDGPAAARRPDGRPVESESEQLWLREVPRGGVDISQATEFDKNTRFLHLWFSHPLFDGLSLQGVTLLDAGDQPLVLGAAGSMSATHQRPSPRNGNAGWITYTASPGVEGHLPKRINVRLRYAFGLPNLPQKIPVTFSGAMALPGGGQLNGIGQDSSGRAFLALACLQQHTQLQQFQARALTKDGHRLTCAAKSISGSTKDNSVFTERLLFDVPLNDIAYFTMGTRDVETMEWTNVPLPSR